MLIDHVGRVHHFAVDQSKRTIKAYPRLATAPPDKVRKANAPAVGSEKIGKWKSGKWKSGKRKVTSAAPAALLTKIGFRLSVQCPVSSVQCQVFKCQV